MTKCKCSRLFRSVETTAKCVSVGPAHCRERLQNPVWFSSASIQRGEFHSGGPRAGSGNGTRGKYSLKEGGHRGGPSSRERVRVLQPVLHSSKEGWRVASHFRSASVEPLSQQTEVQDAYTQAGRVSNQVRGLVCRDRSKRRILPCLHPSHSQEVPAVCFRGQSLPVSGSSFRPSTLTLHFYEVCGRRVSSAAATGRPHTQLHRRLVDSRSIRADGGSTSRCCSRSHESVGVKTERQEGCAFSITENHLSGCGVGFNHDAGKYVPCSDRVDPHGSQECERRPVTHCQAVSETAGSDSSCVQRDTYWPAVHETPTVVAQDQGVLPEGKPASHDQGHAAVPTCLRHVETTLVLVSGPGARSTVSPRNATDASLTGWGAVMSGHPARGLWRGHHLAWHINRLEMLAVFQALKYFLPDLRDHHVLVCTDNTAVVSYINHQGGLRSRPPVQAGASDPCVGPGQTPLTKSSLHPWASQCGSRHRGRCPGNGCFPPRW